MLVSFKLYQCTVGVQEEIYPDDFLSLFISFHSLSSIENFLVNFLFWHGINRHSDICYAWHKFVFFLICCLMSASLFVIYLVVGVAVTVSARENLKSKYYCIISYFQSQFVQQLQIFSCIFVFFLEVSIEQKLLLGRSEPHPVTIITIFYFLYHLTIFYFVLSILREIISVSVQYLGMCRVNK